MRKSMREKRQIVRTNEKESMKKKVEQERKKEK